jgi:hypothetical protein
MAAISVINGGNQLAIELMTESVKAYRKRENGDDEEMIVMAAIINENENIGYQRESGINNDIMASA